MTGKIVALLATAKPKVAAVEYGMFTTPPKAPYVVVKEEFQAGRARFRIIGHFAPAAKHDLDAYMIAADAVLDGWKGEDEAGNHNELAYVAGSATGVIPVSDDGTIAKERVYESPDFV